MDHNEFFLQILIGEKFPKMKFAIMTGELIFCLLKSQKGHDCGFHILKFPCDRLSRNRLAF